MALQQAINEAFLNDGVSKENVRRVYADYTGTWANADTMAVQLPKGGVDGWYEAGAWGVRNLQCWTDTGSTEGSRVHAYKTPAQVLLTSFDEATGIVTLTSAMGSGLVNPKFMLELVGL